ncbi:hypothetical protein CCR97_00385 [Rhodoplanes elegans]|uniref:Uncharacterized protein n=1 Tax=Rhodoplanes elegans TaxID=29408 RepID=A0A327JNW3_9BRAD|nr:hypothetical protein [Rhodoplanes elegans]MBK5956695.1 hypothetical protein [Rhodoplanes elegans]RAI27997.1 hypothetical protein CH338_29695 [Rhodoplanes elegans]
MKVVLAVILLTYLVASVALLPGKYAEYGIGMTMLSVLVILFCAVDHVHDVCSGTYEMLSETGNAFLKVGVTLRRLAGAIQRFDEGIRHFLGRWWKD